MVAGATEKKFKGFNSPQHWPFQTTCRNYKKVIVTTLSNRPLDPQWHFSGPIEQNICEWDNMV